MYIYQTVNEYAFVDAFDKMGRTENFTRQARRELFEYYSELAESCDEPVELDVVGICCDWAEYTESELVEEYAEDGEVTATDDDERSFEMEGLIDRLREETFVIRVEHYEEASTYLVQAF